MTEEELNLMDKLLGEVQIANARSMVAMQALGGLINVISEQGIVVPGIGELAEHLLQHAKDRDNIPMQIVLRELSKGDYGSANMDQAMDAFWSKLTDPRDLRPSLYAKIRERRHPK